MQRAGHPDTGLAVVGLAHDVEPVLLERPAQAVPEHLVIVDQQQAGGHQAASMALFAELFTRFVAVLVAVLVAVFVAVFVAVWVVVLGAGSTQSTMVPT
jgi:hypothetical protein